MLNKKCLFGGLWLGSAVAIFASASSDVIATEEELIAAERELSKFSNELSQISWRIYANNKILAADIEADEDEQSEWIKDPYYRDSIINVIGKAIGDCMACKNEFECTDRQKLGNETIIFKDTDYIAYTNENWNAVMLYNYVNMMLNAEDRHTNWNADTEEVMQKCYEKIMGYYNIVNVFYTEKTREALKTKLNKLEQDEKEIIETLGQKRLNMQARLDKQEYTDEDDKKFAEQDLNNIIQLQRALENFKKNADDPQFYQEAIQTLNQATESKERNCGGAYYEKQTLENIFSDKISQYLYQLHATITGVALVIKLGKAKDDMIAYVQALGLDHKLESYERCLSKHPFVPAKPLRRYCNRTLRGPKYYLFQTSDSFIGIRVQEVLNKENKNTPQMIGYIPNFFIGPDNKIYINKVREAYQYYKYGTWDENERQFTTYASDNEDKYADVLALLQGLVEPLKDKNFP